MRTTLITGFRDWIGKGDLTVFTYLELGRGIAGSFFLDLADIVESDRLRELWRCNIAENDRYWI